MNRTWDSDFKIAKETYSKIELKPGHLWLLSYGGFPGRTPVGIFKTIDSLIDFMKKDGTRSWESVTGRGIEQIKVY